MARRNMFQSSSNPFMSDKNYSEAILDTAISDGRTMTVNGAVNKTFMLLGVAMSTAVFSWMYVASMPWLTWVGAIGGLIMVFVTMWKKEQSAILAPIYAALEGLFLGGISKIVAVAVGGGDGSSELFGGIVFNAILLTMAVLFMMLFVYKTGIIKVTQKFRMGVVMATGAIFVVYIMSWILGMFGIQIPFLHAGGAMGMGISLVIIGIAALNLLLDFDNFERGEQAREPEYMEWFSAMGLMITLVWLYIEILRFLMIFMGDD